MAAGAQVFIQTDRFRTDEPQRSVTASAQLGPPTSDTTRLVKIAVQLLEKLWKDGFRYRKCGILLVDLVQPENLPRDLFSAPPSPKQDRLMAALDAANGRFGRGSLHLGLSAPASVWRMRRDSKTPSYTTSWKELPVVTT